VLATWTEQKINGSRRFHTEGLALSVEHTFVRPPGYIGTGVGGGLFRTTVSKTRREPSRNSVNWWWGDFTDQSQRICEVSGNQSTHLTTTGILVRRCGLCERTEGLIFFSMVYAREQIKHDLVRPSIYSSSDSRPERFRIEGYSHLRPHSL
jgi:hypothetical protein